MADPVLSASLLQQLNPIQWPMLVVVSTRLCGVMLIAPMWSGAQIPVTVRAAIIALFALTIVPTVPAATLPEAWELLPVPLLTELVIGLAIGFVGAALMYGISLTGELMSLQMGLNIGEALGFGGTQTTTGIGELHTMLALVLFVSLDGHLTLLRVLAGSFTRIPPGGGIDLHAGAQHLVGVAGTIFETGVRAAAPIIAALLLCNIGLAVMSRAVPQLNAMSIAFPITLSLGLVVIGLALPFFGRFVGEWMGPLGGHAAQTVDAFVPGGR